ncbi:hypothetical protein GCK32_010966 [Trichostrongylus colubriformis]|uniref:Uncharacterized protein n=1 Tax=Trichostrongylus colubriformis TaxID=6319 RepID=A0AAN8FTG0_TRICO
MSLLSLEMIVSTKNLEEKLEGTCMACMEDSALRQIRPSSTFCFQPDDINMTVCSLNTSAEKPHISLAAHVVIYNEESFLRIGIYSSRRPMWTFYTINSTEYESYKSCMHH